MLSFRMDSSVENNKNLLVQKFDHFEIEMTNNFITASDAALDMYFATKTADADNDALVEIVFDVNRELAQVRALDAITGPIMFNDIARKMSIAIDIKDVRILEGRYMRVVSTKRDILKKIKESGAVEGSARIAVKVL